MPVGGKVNHRISLYPPSRLKGMETRYFLFLVLSHYPALYPRSRLKGIETWVVRLEMLLNVSLYPRSRLKGIETQSTLPE